ncbi:hypothetical protein MMC30_003660 [Trapelia coarctata]|nr:hypothetical protein [Trapelia coarctata]
MPSSRFNAKNFYHPNPNHPGSINATGGYFLKDDPRLFDNAFFGINNLEATYMDPQQRQLLEVCFECFESAGITLEDVSDANVGCYVANFLADFPILQSKDPELFHRYSATGMGLTILANRISNIFNLKGPSFVLDTGCSSSLYALHAACQALQLGECEAAVVAGANLVQVTETHQMMVKAGFLSATSTCHTFDVSADGYGRGEGVAALYVKRLSDAIRDGDPIRSVIRGSAANSNGHTNGLTLPSVSGQEAVIRKAYAIAGIPLDETDYIEAHGTGTPVGDPIEVEALSRVFRHKSGRASLIGSIKTNVGHNEAVSGITSIIKVVLALERGMIPPTIGIKQLNPELRLTERNVDVVMEPTPWPQSRLQRASVNSFGYGGANAHVIIESAAGHVLEYARSGTTRRSVERNVVLVFSAQGETSLVNRVKDLASLDFTSINLTDLAYTLGSRRSNLSARGYLITNEDTLKCDLNPENLQTLESGTTAPTLPLAFVCTGQGAQWPQMGWQLLRAFPTYRRTIQDLDSHLARLAHAPSWTIEDTILEAAKTSKINESSRSQPVCTAIQIALVELLREWNVKPQAVTGHSSGEICAAFVAGYLTAPEALAVAYYRGLVVSERATQGAMAAVGLGKGDTEVEILNLGLCDQIDVACVNSPESSTISGDSAAIDKLVSSLQSQGVFARKLKTDNKAYHSRFMRLLGQDYEDLLSSICPVKISESRDFREVKMFSSVTGRLAMDELFGSPEYWRRNLESPVLFGDAMRELLTDHPYHLIEIGPHPALEQPTKQIVKSMDLGENEMRYSSTLSRGKDAEHTMLDLAGSLFLHQYPVALNRVNQLPPSSSGSKPSAASCKVISDLPAYSWNYGPVLWNEARASTEHRGRKHPRHELLGSRVPGTAGQSPQWRNILKVDEVPWLEDHKLGATIVFPGTGYLALGVEALSQLQEQNRLPLPGVMFRQVNIINVLMLQDNKTGIEIFTELRPSKLSGVTASSKWWHFEVTSFAANLSTVHANGLIAVHGTVPAPSSMLDVSIVSMEEQATRTWYDRLASEGLNFGPRFRSLTNIYNDRNKKLHHAVSKTRLFQGDGASQQQASDYLIHPITLDALLQTSIIASAAGSAQRLRGKVPVTIGSAEIMMPGLSEPSDLCEVFAQSERVGFAAISANAVLRSSSGQVLTRFRDMRAINYEEDTLQKTPAEDRNPVLGVLWKPDISILSADRGDILSAYMDRFVRALPDEVVNTDLGRFAGAVDLLCHWHPRLRILELTDGNSGNTDLILDVLRAGTPVKRFQSYTKATMTGNGDLFGFQIHDKTQPGEARIEAAIAKEAVYDAVIISPSISAGTIFEAQITYITNLLACGATALLSNDQSDKLPLDPSQVSVVSTPRESSKPIITIARPIMKVKQTSTTGSRVVLVERNPSHELNEMLQANLSLQSGSETNRISLEEASSSTIPPRSIVVSTIELQDPILLDPTPDQVNSIKAMTDNASLLVWITGGGLLRAKRPSFSLVLGLARSLMLEQPSLKMFVVDLDEVNTGLAISRDNIMAVLSQAMHSMKPEFEYLQHEGILYSSRFIPDESMSKRFRQGQNAETVSMSLKDAERCQLGIKRTGHLDTLHFDQRIEKQAPLQPDHVEVQVQVVGLNAKDFYTLHGKVDTKNSTCSTEFSGVVTRVGSSVSKLNIGDRVVVMAPRYFATYECVPEWACYRLLDGEEFVTMSTIPIVFSTALYAFEHRASLQPGESVLIHSAAGGLGIAAIQIAQLIGAEIFATVGTDEKRDFLIKKFGLREDHIFNSRDSSFLPAILAATGGRGVDVVLNSLTGDLLNASWQACAEFGRFVEVGKRDIVDGGKLDMAVFGRGVTFTAFDLSDLFWSKNKAQHNMWARLIDRSIALYREGKIQGIDTVKVFDLSETVQAFRYFGSGTRIGKVAVSFEDPQSQIQVIPVKYRTALSSTKAYFLVGCLGGLGRSLSKWMFDRGARKFVFLGRSGTDRTPARSLVESLQEAGAQVTVIRGNVSFFADVKRAIDQIQDPLGGIIQAAMGLDLALFNEMTSVVWRGGIEQKVHGTWHIHNAIQHRSQELDFFLVTSSIAGSIGTATESNYCAANAFLDAFCRHRRSLGLPATALGLGMISQVGYLHENPEIEALLMRKGVHPINEDELLTIIDMALAPDVGGRRGMGVVETFAEAHVLTGLEILGLQRIRAMGWERPTAVLDDPRAAVIAGAYAAAGDDSSSSHPDHNSSSSNGTSALSSSIAAALAANAGNSTPSDALLLATQSIIAEKIGALLLVSKEDLGSERQLAEFGMDSMLAAEFRGAIFRAVGVDLPFVVLLEKRASVRGLAGLVAGRLLEGR